MEAKDDAHDKFNLPNRILSVSNHWITLSGIGRLKY